MKIRTEELLKDLIKRTQKHLAAAQEFKKLTTKELNQKDQPQSWSILECIEHLNLYGDYYLAEIEKQIKNTRYQVPQNDFKSSWLGNYFATAMLPKKKVNKMKTFKDKNPLGSQLDSTVLDKFINQQKKTLVLLEAAKKIDLIRTKTGISISKWIKLRLGDTFRVVIYHNYRHIVQAQNCYLK